MTDNSHSLRTPVDSLIGVAFALTLPQTRQQTEMRQEKIIDPDGAQADMERHYRRFLHCAKCGNSNGTEIMISKMRRLMRCEACGQQRYNDLVPINRR